jgi:TolB protein
MIEQQHSLSNPRRVLVWTGILVGTSLILLSVAWTRLSQNSKAPAPIPNDSATSATMSSRTESTRGEVTKICFTRSSAVYLRDLATSQEKLVLETSVMSTLPSGEEIRLNYGPSLSPAGDAIAFHYQSSPNDLYAAFKILDLNSRRVREFPELAETNSSFPEWSHDGSMIAFRVFKEGISHVVYHVGVLDLASGKWRDITAAPEFNTELGVWLDSWMPDDKSILCHNSEYLYRLGLDGSVLFKLSIESFYDQSSISTSTRLSLTADGKRLLFDSGDPDDAAILVYDLNQKSLSRVTPKTINAIEPRWLPREKEVLFTCFEKNKTPKPYSICKIGVDGKGLTKLVENGRYASYSTR